MAFTPASTLRDLESGATVSSFACTLENTPHQQRLATPLPVLSTSIPQVNVGDPMGEFAGGAECGVEGFELEVPSEEG